MVSKGFGVSISDIVLVGVLVGGIYLISKSGIFQATSGIASSVGNVATTTGQGVSNVVASTTGGVSDVVKSASSSVSAVASIPNKAINFVESEVKKVFTGNTKSNPMIGQTRTSPGVDYYKTNAQGNLYPVMKAIDLTK
jgi:hypothetical protein